MQPPLWESMVLGAIHGLTELLPLSSDGHLALAQMLFDFSSKGQPWRVMVQLGTQLATLVVLWPRVKAALFDGLAALLKPSLFSTTPGARDALVVSLAAIPSALLGLGLRHAVQRWSLSPLAIGLGFLATSVVLIASRFAPSDDGRDDQPGVVGALLLGVAQGLAQLPGLSRGAMTVTLLLLLGVRRQRAFELSLLMSLPIVLGTALVELLQGVVVAGRWLPALVSALAAFAVGLLSLRLLRASVVAGRFSWFAAWVVPVSLATLALAKAWPHG